jgi:hypothetical protein
MWELVEGRGNHNQKWILEPSTGLLYLEAHPERVLSVGDGFRNGQLVHFWERVGSPAGNQNQQWTFTPEGYLALRANPGYVLSLVGDSHGNGAKIHLWERVHGSEANQIFEAHHDRFRATLALRDQRHLNLSAHDGGASSNGGHAHMWELVEGHGNHNQQWIIDRITGSVYLAAHPERVLSIGDGLRNGQLVHFWERVGGPAGNQNQQWDLTPEGYLAVRANPGYVLSLVGDSHGNGAKIHLWERVHGSEANQIFVATQV